MAHECVVVGQNHSAVYLQARACVRCIKKVESDAVAGNERCIDVCICACIIALHGTRV